MSLDVVDVNESIGMCFQVYATVVISAVSAAILTLITLPSMLHALEPDVSLVTLETLGDGVFAHRTF